MAFVKRGSGNLFLQEDPVEVMEYLTSVGVGDINLPGRPRTVKYDPNVRRSGEFVATEFIRGEPGELTAPLARPLDTVENLLQELDCPFVARLNWACRGDRNIVWNYDLAALLVGSEFEGSSIGQPIVAMPSEEDRVMTGGDLKGLTWTYLYLLVGAAQDVDDDDDINDITFLPRECGDECGPRIRLGYEGYAVRDTQGYLIGDTVIYTDDGGGTAWAEAAADPFNGAKNGLSTITVETSTGHRIIVGGGPEAGVAAEISYSDDEGATWTDVTVGATANQGINKIVQDIHGVLWAVADSGFVYRSNNIGLTWTISLAGDGVAGTVNLLDIAFRNQYVGIAVGNDNTAVWTYDGGVTWAALVGPSVGNVLQTIDVNRSNHFYVADDTGLVFRSIDDGANWVETLDLGAGSIARLRFDDKLPDYVGYAIWNVANVGTLLRSEDGGVTWMAWTTPANTGLNGLFICDPNMVYICGNGGFIGKFVRAAG